ncbi:MAG: 3-oxoacyl-ACP synthase [Deltaproteobacteria bacterium RBG_13_43_22]|nr:MAG: 3-oxoacyl-ACP synthase [Deltaproteobacteria bacterium RBG_13_43_22]
MPIQILGTGSYVPPRVLHNRDLEKILDTTDEWISQRTGIHERRIADPEIAASDLALEASRGALEMAGKKAEEVQLIILATITPDTHCPAAANWLQAKLEAPQAVTFDITAACSGFIFALNVAEQYLKSGTVQNVLVVASEIMTRTLNWKDRITAILWGDGAGAVFLSGEGDGPQILSTHIHTDGANGTNLLMPGGGSKTTPISHESVDKDLHTLKMIEASASVRVAVKHFADASLEAVETNGYNIKEVDWVIPHQANLRMIQSLAKRLDLPMEKFFMTIEKYGNISSASVAIALDEAVRTGAIQKGNLILLTAFGGGLTWGSALIRW